MLETLIMTLPDLWCFDMKMDPDPLVYGSDSGSGPWYRTIFFSGFRDPNFFKYLLFFTIVTVPLHQF
jgi:hypothetical protein